MEKTKKFLKLWLPPVAYSVLIFWLSSFEQPFIEKINITHIDKVFHFLEYSLFAFLLIRALYFSDDTLPMNKVFIISCIIGAFCGFTDELHQSIVPGRYATVGDFIADTIGTFSGAAVFILIQKIFIKRTIRRAQAETKANQ